MDALISVIVPVYNVEQYVTKCLDSIIVQTYENLDILLIDDGSTDGSGKICDEFANKDTRIRVIHKPNEGVSSARNLGMQLCTGEYIMFVDSDDYLSENAISCLYKRLILDGSDLVMGRYASVYDGEVRYETCNVLNHDLVFTKEQVFSSMGTKWEFPTAFWGKLYTRKALEGIIVPAIKYGEDTYVFHHIVERCKQISVSSELVYFYVQRENSAIRTKKDEDILECIASMLSVAEFLDARDLKANALTYYKSTIYLAMRVKDRKKARKIIVEKMTRETRDKIIYQDIRTYFRWISLYFPFVFTWVKAAQKTFAKMHNEG